MLFVTFPNVLTLNKNWNELICMTKRTTQTLFSNGGGRWVLQLHNNKVMFAHALQQIQWETTFSLWLMYRTIWNVALMKDDKTNFRYYWNKVKRTGHTLRSDFLKSSLEGVKRGDKKWWNITKQLSWLKMNDNNLHSMANTITNGDMGQLANKINQTFKSVSEDLALLVTAQPQQYDIPDECIVSMDDVERRLMKVQISKAWGPDYIPNWVLCDFAECLAKPLWVIFNASFH